MKTFWLVAFIIFLPLHADEVQKKTLLERMIEPKVSYESSYLSEADVNGYDGSVAVSKNRVSINNKIGGISYTNWSFLWNGVESLPFGDLNSQPIEQMHSIRANVNVPYKINDEWFLLTSLSVQSTFEKETTNSYGAGVFTFASYKLSEDHTIQTGFFMNYHPTSTLALPVLSYSYRTRKTDGMQLVLGFPRTYVGYHLNNKTLLSLGMLFSQSMIKLSDESVIEQRGYVEAQDYMSNVGVAYEFDENFKLSGDLLYSIKRDFTIYDENSRELQSYTIKPSFGANVRLTYIF